MSKKTKIENSSRDNHPSALSGFSYNECIEIQTEAYYRALKRIEAERFSNPTKTSPSRKEMALFALNVFFRPKHLQTKKSGFADGLLNIFVTFTLDLIGYSLRITAWTYLSIGLYNLFVVQENKVIIVLYTAAFIFLKMLGGIFNATSKEIENERDNNKLYAFSASLMATLAVFISIISLLMLK